LTIPPSDFGCAGSAGLCNQGLGAYRLFLEAPDRGLGALKLGAQRSLCSVVQFNLAPRFGVLLLQLRDVVRLPQRLGAKRPKGCGKGLAVFGVALV
jgi:hypothetical protein